MSEDRFDARLTDWLSEGPQQGSVQGLERALAATRRVSQRPAWTFPRSWLPAGLTGFSVGARRLTLVGLLLVLLLLGLVAIASLLVGSPSRVPPPLGYSATQPLAYEAADGIYAALPDGSRMLKLSGSVGAARSPAFSPDGASVAFLAPSPDGGRGGRLYVVPADASSEPIEVSGDLAVALDSVAPISWSTDGDRIAFAADDQGVSRIFVVDANGERLVPITDPSADADLPSWSPDGLRIAFRVTDPDGLRTSLRTALSDGTDVEDVALVIAADGFLSRLAWSSADPWYAYSFSPGFGSQTSAVIDMHFEHTAQPWTDGIGGDPEYGIRWSPDGQHLAIMTAADGVIVADSGESAIAAYPDESGNQYAGERRRLGPVADCWIDWSPDGTALYGGSPDGCRSVVVIPLADPSATFELPRSTGGVASWRAGSDGRP
jgi:dipeptidyl aminopeptidase/acylaminoacyl peptidase